MSTQRAQEILYESEAALRLVDNELHRFRGIGERDLRGDGIDYSRLVESANVQLLAVIEQIRRTRSTSARLTTTADDDAVRALEEIETKLLDVTRLFEHNLSADDDRPDDARPD